MARLNGKHALVTGGTSGIGLETATQFLNEGARVIVTDNNPETMAEARTILGAEIPVIKADSASVAEQQALAAAVRAEFGQLEVAFLAAGISVWAPMEAWRPEAFDRTFAINVKGPFFLIQALLPVLANPAPVIFNSSINAHFGAANSSVYGASKSAFLNLTKTLSAEHLPRSIRFNVVSPGPVDTPLYDKLGVPEGWREQMQKDTTASIPAGRFGSPVEVAKAVVCLASDEAVWTIGSEIVVDGGRMLNM